MIRVSFGEAKFSQLICMLFAVLFCASAVAKPAWKDDTSDSGGTKGKGNGKNKPTTSSEIIVHQSLTPQVVVEGDTAQFSVLAESSDGRTVNYQWFHNGQAITNANQNSFLIASTQVSDQGEYTVSMSNGDVSQSQSAALTVEQTPVAELDIQISLHPVSQAGYENDALTLNVSATGSGNLRYQWRKNSVDIPDAIHEHLTLGSLTMDDAASYDVVITNETGQLVSNAAEISVNKLASINLSWDTPTSREDGSLLDAEEIDSYKIYVSYEHEPESVISVASTSNTLELDSLRGGIYYFEIATTDTTGVTGARSEQISLLIN